MPSAGVWYLAAFQVVFAKPFLDSSASPSLLTPVGSDTIEQLDLNPANLYSPLSFDSSTLVASPINQESHSVFGAADLTQTVQVKEDEVQEKFTGSAGLPDPVVQDNEFPGQEVSEPVVPALLASNSVIQDGDSAGQNLPVQHASTNDLPSSVIQGSGWSDQTPDETTPINSLSFTIAQDGHPKTRSCSSNQARSVKRQAEKRNAAEPSRPQQKPATLRGPRPPKQQPKPETQPGEEQQPNLPGQLPQGNNEPDECFYIPKCEDIDGRQMRLYCCPYVQKIGYDDRHVRTRTGCTNCSYQSPLCFHSVLPDTRTCHRYMNGKSPEYKTNTCTVWRLNFMCEKDNDWMGAFCCFPGSTVCRCFLLY